MASFRRLTVDPQPLETYKSTLPRPLTGKGNASDSRLSLHLFEWFQSGQEASESFGLKSAEDLQSQNQATVRVVFAPLDVPTLSTIDGLCELFERCQLPSAFIAEGLQNVSQSFAALKDVDGTTWVWFHFLCKDIAVSEGRIVHPRESDNVNNSQQKDHPHAQNQSQANFTWLKPGFVLKVKDGQRLPAAPSRTTTSSSGSTLTPASVKPSVELFCFGAPVTLRGRFQKLKDTAACDDLLREPYVFMEIVLEEMYRVMDRTAWMVSDIFGPIETKTLEMASRPGKATKELSSDHFTGLHNLAKHCIYLRENCASALAILEGLRDHVTEGLPTSSQEFTMQALKYQKTLLESTQRRLASLDARMANIIQLSFHIVTQGDSRLMQSESQSMKTIAVMTLVFMPLTTVASIFGSQFIKLQDEAPHHITVSRDFWLLWIIAVPLTAILLVFWRVWYADAKGRLVDEIPRDAERYMGWKTLLHTMRRPEDNKKGQFVVAMREVTANTKV